MAEVAETCPREDRTPERRVFVGFTPDVAKNLMARGLQDGRDRSPAPARPTSPLRLGADRPRRARDSGGGATRAYEEVADAGHVQSRPHRLGA
jgi:hypothetical protein